MARFVLADDGIRFDGGSISEGPLGGVESSVINLAKELATRGHKVSVHNRCLEPRNIDGVDWVPIAKGLPEKADLYIANRGDNLIALMPRARQTVFWVHNPANYLLKWRYLSKLWRYNPIIVFIGDYHSTTYPSWAPGRERVTIPYGISEEFRSVEGAKGAPLPRAIFTSNPLRSLSWLLDLWTLRIQPFVPNSELHLFSGSATYGEVGARKGMEISTVLDKAKKLGNKGVLIRDPVSKLELIEEFRKSRVMLYRGDINETFCLALGEAQAAGVPAVVQKYGSVVERVKDGLTGALTESDDAFVEAAIKLLTDDKCWLKAHQNAQAFQRDWGWSQAAEAFERLLP